MAKARVKVPKSVKKGDVFAIKTIITHKMETGLRKDNKGNKIPRLIIRKFICTYNGKTVFECDLYTSISANPFLSFFARAEKSGRLDFKWIDDKGDTVEKSAKITVE